jgi:hypothetical protein
MVDKYGARDVVGAFSMRWGLAHYSIDRKGVLPVHYAKPSKEYSIQVGRIPNDELKSDFKLIVYDLTVIQGVREFRMAKHAYLAVFVGKARLEVIASKYGATPGKHHFYHWQAIAKGQGVDDVVAVDDSSVEDDDL